MDSAASRYAEITGRGKVLVLRTCQADGKSNHGFAWPTAGPVACDDWSPEPVCGHGLHGLLWGEGDGRLLAWDSTARWLVVEVDARSVVELNGKVKFPCGVVVYCGDRVSATAYLADRAPGRKIVGSTATAGDDGTATAGDRGTATAGNRGTATAGDDGTATAGYGGTAVAGDRGTATAGDRGTASAGYGGTAIAGDGGTASAGYRGIATAGDEGTATAGNGGTATAGYEGTAIAGNRGTAIAGDGGTASAGNRGIATAGNEGTAIAGYGGTAIAGDRGIATAGDRGRLCIRYDDRFIVASVGDEVDADVPYRLDDKRRFVAVRGELYLERI